ncbi:MAG TPA: 4Fe-4S dicluster domain-containing protein [Candidatus Limnocylindrales bacterium]|nr:4Fe-4S dicluster domain-containing protein [Candidatus Limnocylindrales bacterium]
MVSAVEPKTYFLPRQDLAKLLDRLHDGGRQVIGPTIRDGAVMLDPIERVDQLPVGWGIDNAPGKARLVEQHGSRVFDQPPGPSSWKRWTYPPRLTEFAWTDAAETDAAPAPRRPKPVPAKMAPQAFLGVRACEIAALRVQDKVLLEGPVVDRDYAARRRDNLIVAVECAVAGGTCFCTSMGTGPEVRGDFDLALSELDDGFVVRVGTDAGRAALEGLTLPAATSDQTAAAAASVARVRAQMGEPLPMDGLPDRLMAAAESPRWAKIAERCLACTNCTLVCPTCFCTSISQRSDLDGDGASAERTWDSCFTLDFARVAGGNFRTRVEDRYRQWLTHKFGTWWPQFGSSGCVGCGRCIAWCPVGIDVREELLAVAPPVAPAADPPPIAPVAPMPSIVPSALTLPTPTAEGPRPMPWRTVEVLDRRRETRDVITLSLGTDDPGLLAGRPGQFVMAALPAVAAPPISVSRFHPDGLELTIRAAGPATAAIVNLERGDTVALRGPLGRGWPVELAEGRDVMVITGGIGLAPLRPLLDHMLARRDRIAHIHLAYGARTPGDRLYVDELDRLAASGVIDVAQTVDRAGPEWLGRVGVVTQVIDRIMCSCDRTIAFVCGPERMMRATVDVLHERGIPDERIWVTLERHMDCGVGLCGHCQLGRYFVCEDGPVFSLAELGPAFAVEGL